MFKYPLIFTSLSSLADKITDFETGSNKIDISPLNKINGHNVRIKQVNTSLCKKIN
ncbi:MAG TPA: M10 family metallopeptidase C-terminal domain-containing protein [Arsenophonus sp.]